MHFTCEQVDLKLKVCRGDSVRKLLVREAKAFHAATTIVGTSKTHHRIGSSSTSVAKYCARKLSKNFSVFAVDNGKIVFKRVGTDSTADQFQGFCNFLLLDFVDFSLVLPRGCFFVNCGINLVFIQVICLTILLISHVVEQVMVRTGAMFILAWLVSH